MKTKEKSLQCLNNRHNFVQARKYFSTGFSSTGVQTVAEVPSTICYCTKCGKTIIIQLDF